MEAAIEWAGVATALVYLALSSSGRRSCFIFGFISSAIFTWVCFREKLYFDTAINTYYLVMSVAGWISWKESVNGFHAVTIKGRSLFLILFISALASVCFGFGADKFTDASLPYADALATVTAVAATWMLVRRILENWLIWIISDGISIWLFYTKDHLPMAALFAVYTVIAVYAYFNWKRKFTAS